MPIRKSVRIAAERAGARVPGPASDDRHAVGARPPHPVVDQQQDDLEEEQAAEEHQQVPPAPERHRQHDRRQADHRRPPPGARRRHPVGDAGQPRRPHPGEKPEHRGVGLIIKPQRRRAHRDHDRAGQHDNHGGQPCRGGDRDRVRQRRRGAGRAAAPYRWPRSGTRRTAVHAVPRGHRLGFPGHCAAPAIDASPRPRGRPSATAAAAVGCVRRRLGCLRSAWRSLTRRSAGCVTRRGAGRAAGSRGIRFPSAGERRCGSRRSCRCWRSCSG